VKPTFNQKYEFEYNSKLPAQIQVSIFNSNSITSDDHLGTVQVRRTLRPGSDRHVCAHNARPAAAHCESRHALVSHPLKDATCLSRSRWALC
jgi:hypothetical protein